MEAWGNFWQKGHSTTFGEYYADGYTKGYIADWWSDIIGLRQEESLNILEVGCGNASLVPCLLDLNIKGTYTGVDAAKYSCPRRYKNVATTVWPCHCIVKLASKHSGLPISLI